MPFAIIAAAIAVVLVSSEHRVNRHQQQVADRARARTIAVADPSCQDSLRFATTDSARATIIDGCVARILDQQVAQSRRVAERK